MSTEGRRTRCRGHAFTLARPPLARVRVKASVSGPGPGPRRRRRCGGGGSCAAPGSASPTSVIMKQMPAPARHSDHCTRWLAQPMPKFDGLTSMPIAEGSPPERRSWSRCRRRRGSRRGREQLGAPPVVGGRAARTGGRAPSAAGRHRPSLCARGGPCRWPGTRVTIARIDGEGHPRWPERNRSEPWPCPLIPRRFCPIGY